MSLLSDTSHYKKVLVIDDNEIDRYKAGQCIEKYGFAEEWVLKESASKALIYLMSLERTPEELPELIFLGVAMPEKDGFVFMEHYQKLSEIIKLNCSIILLATPFNANDEAQTRSNKYICRSLNKPIDKEKLQTITLEIPTRNSRKRSHAA